MISWTPKEKRILINSVQFLFSPKAFIRNPTKEYFQDIRNLGGIININGKQLFISPKSRDIYSRLTDVFIGKHEIYDLYTKNEVFQQMAESHKSLLTDADNLTHDTYLQHVISSLTATNKEYKFLIPVDGVELADEDKVSIGNITLCRSDKSILSEIELAPGEDIDIIFEQIKSKYWMIGEVCGGPEFARSNFERSAQIAVGIIAIYWSAMFKWGFILTRIRPKLTPYDNRSSAPSLRWEKDGGQLTTTRDFGDHQPIKLSSKLLSEFTSNLFFDQFATLATLKAKTELQCALITAILWFYDAYNDQHNTMKFIKLWSCSECFFSKSQQSITDDNATGIAVILAYGGYEVISLAEYNTIKSKAKKLYALRSKAVHNAELDHITRKDTDTLAHWISWLIISIFALSEHGYTTLRQVKEQIDRLVSIEVEASRSTQQSSTEE